MFCLVGWGRRPYIATMYLRYIAFSALAAVLFAPVMARADLVFSGPVVMGDGDSLRVGGSQNLRLIGIDAPELDQTCTLDTGATFACGTWVAETVRKAFNGRAATCTAQQIDRYDRPLVTCTIGGEDLGARLVREGLALTYRESTTYAAEEKAAILADRGLWSMDMQDPSEHRRARATNRAAPNSAPDPACTIKGNISSNGRIYHRPGDENYARTNIRVDRGERWFCTEAEARAAGWRGARR